MADEGYRVQEIGEPCPSCGQRLDPGVVICLHCGYDTVHHRHLHTVLEDERAVSEPPIAAPVARPVGAPAQVPIAVPVVTQTPELWEHPNVVWILCLVPFVVGTFILGLILGLARSVEWLRCLAGLLSIVVLLLIPARLFTRNAIGYLRLDRMSAAHLPHVLGVGIASLIAYQQLSTLFYTLAPPVKAAEQIVRQLMTVSGEWGWVGALIWIVLVPAVCEEIFFRGLALRALTEKLGAISAILISSLAFSAAHLDIVGGIPRFLLGIVLGLVALRTGSVWYCAGFHAAVNTAALLVFHGANQRAGEEEFLSGWLFLLGTAATLLCLFLLPANAHSRPIHLRGTAGLVAALLVAALTAHIFADRNVFGSGRTKKQIEARLERKRDEVRGLAHYGRDSVRKLAKALQHEDLEVRRMAAWGLANRAPEAASALSELRAAADDDDQQVRLFASLALARLDRDVPTLRTYLQHENADVRRMAAEALAGETVTADESVAALATTLNDPNPKIRQQAAKALANADPDAAGLEQALLEAAGSTDPKVRVTAIAALGTRQPPSAETLQLLDAALTDPLKYPRVAAGQALGRLGAPAVPVLLKALQSPEPPVRMIAADAIAAIGPDAAEAVPLLTGLLQDPDSSVQGSAGPALISIGPPSVPVLIELLDSDNERLRIRVINILAKLKHHARPAVPELQAIADDGQRSPRERQKATKALKRIQG